MPESAATLQMLSPSRVREAELLADMLRISRLTILYGQASVGKTTLLVTGVLPLLCRRGADREAPQVNESNVVVPFPKCRRRDRSPQAEVAVFFDAWNEAPLATLTERLLAALPREYAQVAPPQSTLSETLTALSRDLGARFLILLDRFEEYLTAPPDRPGIPEFADEFLRMLQNPQLPANFLVSVQEYAEPLMERLRARVRGLGDASLRLDSLERRIPAIVQSLHEHEHAQARRAHDHLPLQGSAAGPQFVDTNHRSGDATDLSSAETLDGSGAATEDTPNALEAARYEWAVASELPSEPIAYSPAENIWATFGAAQHEWTLAFQLAGQRTGPNEEAQTSESVATAETAPVEVSDLLEPALEETVAQPESTPSDGVLAFEAVPEVAGTASEPVEEEAHLTAAPAEPGVEPLAPEPSEPELISAELPPQIEPSETALASAEPPQAEPQPTKAVESDETGRGEPSPEERPSGDEPTSIDTPEARLESEQTSVESVPTPDAAVAAMSHEPGPAEKRAAKRWNSRAKWLGAAGAVTAIAAAVWTVQNVPLQQLPASTGGDTPKSAPAPEAAKNAPPPEPALPPLPQIALVTEPGNSTDAQVAADLARLMTAERTVHVAHRADMLSWPDDDASRLAIVRYEALDAANRTRARTGEGTDKLRIVTPLYTEEIHVIARRDSPLNFIHEIRNAKLNIGPSTGSRGLTAVRLYERMFGKPIPQDNLSGFSDDEALSKLVNEKSIDAMIVVAGQPSAWLAEIPPQLASSIKLLKHDREHPTGQRAIEAYLPTTIRRQSYSKWLHENTPALATMTFLVGSEGTSTEALERFDLFTDSFCRNLDRLRSQGHPKWREVQVGFDIDTGWPYSPRAKKVFHACLAEAKPPLARAPR